MNINEQDVRALVREAIERHQGRPDSRIDSMPNDSTPEAHVDRESHRESPDSRRARLQSSYGHPSHILLTVLPGSEVDDGMCVIEPRVRCNHCGFCQSYGH